MLGPLVWQRHSREGDRADRTPTYSTWNICNMGPVVSLVIADPQQLLAEGLAILLDAEDDFAVLGVAHDGLGALELTAEHQPPSSCWQPPCQGALRPRHRPR